MCHVTGTPDQDIALFEVLLEETTSYQPQPELSIKDREELVSEVSGDLMQPGAIDPNVADEGLLVPAGADGGSPHMMRIASGAAAFFFFLISRKLHHRESCNPDGGYGDAPVAVVCQAWLC